MLILRQSTAIDIRMGPFLDATDGVTPETGITLAGADQAEVLKENGAATVAMAGTFSAITGCDGWYDYTCATGDVDTVGEVVFVVQDSSVCLPVYVRGFVVEEAVYDALYDAGAAGPLQSTTAGRTLDVTSTGAAGIDWGNIENPTTTVDLSATTIDSCDDVTGSVGSVTGAVGSVTGAVGSVTAQVTANVTAISGDSVAADNLELDYDGTGYNKANSTIGTCTTNTDMRGTDSALLASSAPTNFGDLSITATTGRVDVASVAGTAQTANDNGADINAILVDKTL